LIAGTDATRCPNAARDGKLASLNGFPYAERGYLEK